MRHSQDKVKFVALSEKGHHSVEVQLGSEHMDMQAAYKTERQSGFRA